MPHLRANPVAAAMALLIVAASPSAAQAPEAQAMPAQAQQSAQTSAPPKPYDTVPLVLAPGIADPTLDAFRKQLADIAASKDRAALIGLVAAKDFFWERERGNAADKDKPGIENFATAIGLDAKDGSGWQALADYASEPSLSQVGDRKDFVCAPAAPIFDEKQFEALLQSSGTDPGEWGYPLQDGIEVRDSAAPDGKTVEKLGWHFVRVMPEDEPAPTASLLRIVAPSGKVGYLPVDALLPLGVDQLCYIHQADGWKIAGYVGEGAAE
jgi:hypothetical protein